MKLTLYCPLLLTALLFSCGGHLGTPLDIPGGIGGEIDDAAYRARRKKVYRFVKNNEAKIRKGDISAIDEAIRIAEVSESKIGKLKNELQDPKTPFLHPNELLSEKLSNQYLVLYPPNTDGKSNGFSFNAFYKIIRTDVNARPAAYYESAKSGNANVLDSVMNTLRISEQQKRQAYVKSLNDQFESIYIEPIVVLFMSYSS